MQFNAEATSQNKKSVQCFICLQYNHVTKYCKTKQQICAKCGDNHRIEQCTVANDAIKCNNCKETNLQRQPQNQRKQNNKPTTTSAVTTAKPTTTTNTNKTPTQSSITTNDSIKKLTPKPKPTAKTSKINRSLDSSLDSTIMDTKDRKGVGMGARTGMNVFT
ncbi:unnamed protein product [Rotaria magnacalcarata]|uniref:Uncharacterized protein n=1 Tax=Rotaria magnacalcarata TaxID=392030 RepID=A0A820IJL7_9BILA|nr:unnamed protein product [Rotaria magnacalcarata]